jgi:putative spermidine/putrescine transport system substrate-binding protein
MSAPERTKAALAPEEGADWYEGAPAGRDLLGPAGAVVVKTGAKRAGGTYQDRANHIALWNTVMEEYNYAARAWDRFIRRVNEGQK